MRRTLTEINAHRQRDLFEAEEIRIALREGAKDAHGRKIIIFNNLASFGTRVTVVVPYGSYAINDAPIGAWLVDDVLLLFLNGQDKFILTFAHQMLPTAQENLDNLLHDFGRRCTMREHLVCLDGGRA